MKKRPILIGLIILVVSSCEIKQDMSITEKENKEIIEQFFEHFNNHDWQKMADIYIDEAEFKDPSLGKVIYKLSYEEIIAKYSELNEIFPDIHDEVIQLYFSGKSNIIVEFVSTGTAVDGTALKLPICTIFTIEKGKITKDYTYFDN